MEKNSLKEDDIDYEFAMIGKLETVEKQQKVKEKRITESPEENDILFDGRQYSCKIPKKIMETISYNKGDKLRFTLIKIPSKQKAMIKVEYVRQKIHK